MKIIFKILVILVVAVMVGGSLYGVVIVFPPMRIRLNFQMDQPAGNFHQTANSLVRAMAVKVVEFNFQWIR